MQSSSRIIDVKTFFNVFIKVKNMFFMFFFYIFLMFFCFFNVVFLLLLKQKRTKLQV